MNSNRVRWRIGVSLAIGMSLFPACADIEPPARSEVTCLEAGLVSYTAADVSESGRSDVLIPERLEAIEAILVQTAVCGGRAKVVAFTNSAAASFTVFEGDLKPAGATDVARRRRVPKMVEEVMVGVRQGIDTAIATLPGGGTDVIAQLQLAHEYHQQLGLDRLLIVKVLSDGLSTTGDAVLNRSDLGMDLANRLAEGVKVPVMGGTTKVIFAGIGRVSGTALPPTSAVDALKAFYLAACGRTEAECTVVTDLSTGMER